MWSVTGGESESGMDAGGNSNIDTGGVVTWTEKDDVVCEGRFSILMTIVSDTVSLDLGGLSVTIFYNSQARDAEVEVRIGSTKPNYIPTKPRYVPTKPKCVQKQAEVSDSIATS